MSVADRTASVAAPLGAELAPSGRRRRLSGWGRAAFSRATVVKATSAEQIASLLAGGDAARNGLIARGGGRSYGDAAQNGGGTVVDLTALREILAIDEAGGCVRVQAGVTYAQLLAEIVPRGLMLPVIPGTRHVTIGGAIASDVHGKNHFRDGSLAAHVRELTVYTPDGAARRVRPADGDELALATLGGMGLTGIVTEATLEVEPLAAPWWLMDTDRTASLAETLELMGRDEGHRFSVAWLDLMARGVSLGRGVLTRSNDWPAGLPSLKSAGGRDELRLLARPRVRVPRGFPGSLLAAPLIAAFNELRWRTFPRRERDRPTPLTAHFFPLDRPGEWNRLYGARGLLQYQFVVPDGHEAAVVRCVELLRERRVPVYLAVLKRLGPASGGLLSFPLEGWTLALDIPAWAADARPTLDLLDELVADAGGRVYLTKDLRLRRDLLGAMYPELERFKAVRDGIDPTGLMHSDLGSRLGICGARR